MSGVKHTPGPWTARRVHTGGFDIFDERGRDVVTVYGGGVETESREANARLIAAAPDLLEALSRAVHSYDGVPPRHHPAWFDEARAAIARARGGKDGGAS